MELSRRVLSRKAGREDAEQLRELINWKDHDGVQYAEAFLKRLAELLPAKRSRKPKPVCIARLGATMMNYGEYNGKGYDEVPRERLDWYLKVQEEAVRSLTAYLNHPEVDDHRRQRGCD